MKKLFILTGMLILASSSAFAVDNYSIDLATAGNQGLTLYGAKSGATTSSPLIGKTSTGVGLGILVDTTGLGYSLVTQHKQGTKEFGSSYDSTSIYSIDVTTVGTAVLTKPTTITSADFLSGSWTSM